MAKMFLGVDCLPVNEANEITDHCEIKKLKSRLNELRIGRRILMSLLEKVGEEKIRLEQENQRLQRCNTKYARELIKKNTEIARLKSFAIK